MGNSNKKMKQRYRIKVNNTAGNYAHKDKNYKRRT